MKRFKIQIADFAEQDFTYATGLKSNNKDQKNRFTRQLAGGFLFIKQGSSKLD